MSKIKEHKLLLFYIVLLGMSCISLIFTNFSYDAEYQLAMGYRMVQGDSMITEMWEPHQTSAFLCAFLIKLFIMCTGSTTGIVLFIQAVGFLLRLGISIYLYRIMRSLTGMMPAAISGILYLLISPKDLLVPEFSNMQLWFATLMFLTFVHYLQNSRTALLLVSAGCLCLGVLSYPSFIMAFPVMLVLLWIYSSRRKRDLLIYAGICAGIGSIYGGYFLIRIGWDTIADCLSGALALEPTHTVGFGEKVSALLAHFGEMVCVLAGVGIAGWLLTLSVGFATRSKTPAPPLFSKERWILLSWHVLLAFLLANILRADNHSGPSYLYLVIITAGLWKRSLLSLQERIVYDCALWIGIANLAATLLLSDHGFLQAVPYMLIAVCGSVLPLYRWYEALSGDQSIRKMYTAAVHLLLLLIMFRSIYWHIPISGRGQICTLLSDMAFIRSGPAAGIFTDELGAAMQRDSYYDWNSFVEEGDTIWILGDPVDTLGYLYLDTEVGAPTVMSTPTYNEELLRYWEHNPDKYPNVIMLSSNYEEISWDLLKNNWLIDWLGEEYMAEEIEIGTYWVFLRKDG